MKHQEFNREPLFSRFRVPEPFVPPLLSAEPSVTVHMLSASDELLIIASDGLWEYLSNQEALDIVSNNGRKVNAAPELTVLVASSSSFQLIKLCPSLAYLPYSQAHRLPCRILHAFS